MLTLHEASQNRFASDLWGSSRDHTRQTRESNTAGMHQGRCDGCKGLGPTHVPMSPRARTAVWDR